MFRTLLPRAAPRAALRTARPQSVPSNFVAAPTLSFFSKRGYASESGMWPSFYPAIERPGTGPALPKTAEIGY